MGVLNITPDSFSDGGEFLNRDRAVLSGVLMAKAGASVIDVGGESTRPGSLPVSPEEEISRVVPVIEALTETGVRVSCDTSKPEVASLALRAGAVMINDVRGFRDAKMREAAAKAESAICIMHMRETPETMQIKPDYEDVIDEVKGFLYRQAEECEACGIAREKIIIDPGIGFGKNLEHNLSLIANIDIFAEKYPVMIGASRKSFLGGITGVEPPKKRLGGSLAVACWAALKGAYMVRVHDVEETLQAVRTIKEIRQREYCSSALERPAGEKTIKKPTDGKD